MPDTKDNLAKTSLYDLHIELGAKMVPFATYAMPVQYGEGVLKEHLHTRQAAGLFDVSHMGQLLLKGANAAAALEALVPGDIQDLGLNKQRYTLLTNDEGGIIDDLMVVNRGDSLFLVVNAACKDADIAHLRAALPQDVLLEELEDRALLALQGPQVAQLMSELSDELDSLFFMDAKAVSIQGISCFVTRSGYTGEDGFEISVANADAPRLARLLLANEAVKPIGLGARDSLRLEAGLCLYGHDLNQETTPVEAALNWVIPKVRREGGARSGGFPGANRILEQLASGAATKRVGLQASGRAPVREGAQVVTADGVEIGKVTSGGFGPTVARPVAMAYVESEYAAIGTPLFAIVRGKQLPVVVSKPQFVEQRYRRG